MATAQGTARHRRELELGMALMATAMLMLPGIDAFAKLLAATLSPGQVAWGRFVFQSLLLLAVMRVMGRPLGSRQLGVHAARGLLIAAAILLFVWAVKYLPIANALAIFFVEPLLLTLLSAVFLGERVGGRRLAAVVVGLLGALVVIRPNWQAFGWAAVLPLGTAICFAGYLTLTRHLAVAEDPLAMQFWGGLFAAAVLSVAVAAGQVLAVPVLEPAWPDAREWLLFLGLGVVATVGHLVIAFAFRYAPAGVLAPFQYLEIISATVLGLLVFGDFPDAMTWLGTALIVGAGLYVFLMERGPAPGPPPPDQP